MRRAPIALLALAALVAAAVQVGAAPETDARKADFGGSGYPQYSGPEGNFRPTFATSPLTDDPNTFLKPISFDRCSVLYETRPSNPIPATNMAQILKTLMMFRALRSERY